MLTAQSWVRVSGMGALGTKPRLPVVVVNDRKGSDVETNAWLLSTSHHVILVRLVFLLHKSKGERDGIRLDVNK